jgi:DNA polymerase-3 subunit epsilon
MIGRWRRRRVPWHTETYWALDLETTGLDSRRDRIVSVGMVPIIAGVIRWGQRFDTLVRNERNAAVSVASMAVHQILPEDGRDAPVESTVLDAVLERLAGSALLVHHAPLDTGFLRAACVRNQRSWPKPPVVDTVRLLAKLDARIERLEPYPRPLPRGLSDARGRLGLPKHAEHHALADATATAELFLVLRSRLDARRLGHLL